MGILKITTKIVLSIIFSLLTAVFIETTTANVKAKDSQASNERANDETRQGETPKGEALPP